MLFTVTFGPWAPDLANVPVQVAYPVGSQPVPCADCLNVYYADGTYRSLPNPTQQAGPLSAAPVGIFTALDQYSNPMIYAGNASGVSVRVGSSWTSILTGAAATQWSFCQFGTSI